jgi:hypothetical protein
MSSKSQTAKQRSFARQAHARAAQERVIQNQIDRKEGKARPKARAGGAMQAGARPYPAPPLPAQHLAKPGRERDLELAPMYDAPYYRGSDKLLDMVALITGGDSGIGRSVAVLFAREGADVAIAYLDEDEDAEETKRAVEKEGRRCILLSGDVADAEFCRFAVEATVAAFGKLDILVNNAAFQEHASKLEGLSDEHFDRTIKTNLYGYFYMARAAVPQMANGSSIIMTGSVTGILGSKDLLDYSMTKGHSRLCAIAGDESRRPGHSGQCRRTGPGLDPAQPGRQAGEARAKLRRRRADETARATRGDRAGLCVLGGAFLLKLHHRRSAADHRRIFGRLTGLRAGAARRWVLFGAVKNCPHAVCQLTL